MKYEIYGPFDLKRDSNYYLVTNNGAIKSFWDEIDEEYPSLKSACGCYVFSINDYPFYVGQTKRTFKDEVFNARNRNLYSSFIQERVLQKKRGIPRIYLIAKKTASGSNFAKPPSDKKKLSSIDFVENMLIKMAYERNENVLNHQGKKVLKNLEIPGLFNSPRKISKSSKSLKKVLISK